MWSASGVPLGPLYCAVGDGAESLSVEELADGGVVLEGHLRDFKFWIDGNFERVIPGLDVRNVDPLTVDCVLVDVAAVDGNPLVAVVSAGIPRFDSGQALVVLETEGRFMSLRHSATLAVINIKRREYLHAVVVPETY
jgi:hypothetical protein